MLFIYTAVKSQFHSDCFDDTNATRREFVSRGLASGYSLEPLKTPRLGHIEFRHIPQPNSTLLLTACADCYAASEMGSFISAYLDGGGLKALREMFWNSG